MRVNEPIWGCWVGLQGTRPFKANLGVGNVTFMSGWEEETEKDSGAELSSWELGGRNLVVEHHGPVALNLPNAGIV